MEDLERNEEDEELVRMQNEIENLKEANVGYASELENYRLMLEIANERWINQVNENTQLQVQIRKTKK